jgi:hypothetical protein
MPGIQCRNKIVTAAASLEHSKHHTGPIYPPDNESRAPPELPAANVRKEPVSGLATVISERAAKMK